MKKIILIFFILNFQLFKQEIIAHLSECLNNQRIISFTSKDPNEKVPEFQTENCKECKKGEYLVYDFNLNSTKCSKCPNDKTNAGKNIKIFSFNEKYFKQFNFINDGWIFNEFNLKSIFNNNNNNKNTFEFKQYFSTNGKFSFEFITNFINSNNYLKLFINNKEIYNSFNNSDFKEKTSFKIYKYFYVFKGFNIFKFEHFLTEKNNFVSIFNIFLENVEFSSFSCDYYLPIEKLSLNKCEFENKCSNEFPCSNKFYSTIFEDCDAKTNKQTISYKKIPNSICNEEKFSMKNKITECKKCPLGTILLIENNKKICKSCENNFYIDEIDKNKCKICNNKINYLFYDIPEIPNFYKIKIKIVELFGKITLNLSKFDKKKDSIIFIQINDQTKKFKNSIPNNNSIELPFGEYFFTIKGSNLNIKNISIFNTSIFFNETSNTISQKNFFFGGFSCSNFSNFETINLNCKEENDFYSFIENKCLNCPIFTHLNKNNQKCDFDPIFSSEKFLSFIDFENLIINYGYPISIEDYEIILGNKTTVKDLKKNVFIGEEINKVQIVSGKYERGVILTLNSFDLNEFKNYSSIIYIKTNPEIGILKPKFIKNEKNSFYFIIETNEISPLCLNTDLYYYDSDCVDNKMIRTYSYERNKDFCKIRNIDNKINNFQNDKNSDQMFINSNNKNDKNILYIFSIYEKIPFQPNKNSYILKELKTEIKCKFNFKKYFRFLLYFFLMIIFSIFIFICFKFMKNKLKKYSYMNLKKNKINFNNQTNVFNTQSHQLPKIEKNPNEIDFWEGEYVD